LPEDVCADDERVLEATAPPRLAETAFKAARIATPGTPGPVVLVVPDDVRQQPTTLHQWTARQHDPTQPTTKVLEEVRAPIEAAERRRIIAGEIFEGSGGREALLAFAETWRIPVAASFRRHDLFPDDHPLLVGDIGLDNPQIQLDAFHDTDLMLAFGTRIGDITSQG